MTENSDYLDATKLSKLESAVTKYMNKQISSYLYKISKEYNSDLDGFGRYAVKNFLTTKKWEDYGWLDNFNTAFFDVNVSTDVKSGYILMES